MKLKGGRYMLIKPTHPKYIKYEYFQEGRIQREQIQFIFQGNGYSNSFYITKILSGSILDEYESFEKTDELREEKTILTPGRFLISRYFIYDSKISLLVNINKLFHSQLEEIGLEEIKDKIHILQPPPDTEE